MISAIVPVKTDPKRVPQCATKLAGIEGVARVYAASGEWDRVALAEVVAEVVAEAVDCEAPSRVVTEQFAIVPGIVCPQTPTACRVYSTRDLEQTWDIGVD